MMIRNMQKTLLALALVGSSMSAQAAFDLRVIGTIAPAACTPTLGGGGTVDYNAILVNTLSDTALTPLSTKSIPIAISCDAPAKVALMGKSGRMGSLAGATERALGQGFISGINLTAVGLGLHGTEKIGGYAIMIKDVALDGVASVIIDKTLYGTSWSQSNSGNLFRDLYSNVLTFGVSAATGPVAFREMVGTVEVKAYINKKSELDVTTPVALDGLTIIDLIYL